MRQSGGFVRQLSEAYRHLSDGERVCAFLRELYPDKTAVNVAADTGISARTIEKWLERASAPSWPHGVRLMMAYGPEFVCACTDDPPDWLTEAGRAQTRARLDARLAEIEALRRAVAS